MKLKVYTPDGSAHADKEFPHFPSFEDDKGVEALRQVVLAHQANDRQGDASTKTRTEVAGTGKKPFKQKGGGRARQGTWRAPQHYHGAVAFGPNSREYTQKINKKMRQLAFRRALFERARDGELDVIEKWELADAKTRLISGLLARIAPRGKLLLVDDQFDEKLALAARNMPRVTLAQSSHLSSLDLVRYDRIIVSEKGVDTVLTRSHGGKES